ncbi:uncharacterized protein [Prorops nasuta]
MQKTHTIINSCSLCRSIYTNSSNFVKSIGRHAVFLTKMINKDKPKKKVYHIPGESRISNALVVEKSKSIPAYLVRRMTMYNKLYMEYITDLLGTGEVSPELLNKKIEITRVHITPYFDKINIYYTSSYAPKCEKEKSVHEILEQSSYALRHQLSQLRLGKIPILQFVVDKEIQNQNEVERLLAIADFGNNSEVEAENADTFCNTTQFPQMRHDIFGLDHYKIITRVRVGMEKHRQAAKIHEESINDSLDNLNTNSKLNNLGSWKGIEFIPKKEQQDMFTNFIKKRKIEVKKKISGRKLEKSGRFIETSINFPSIFDETDEEDL